MTTILEGWSRGSRTLWLVALLAAAGTAAGTVAVPDSGPAPPCGQMVEGVATLADPGETYTLFLPTGYCEPAGGAEPRLWPALLVFDPRGRSRQAAERFAEGAETFGWILLSTDGTRSDGPWEPNERAVRALLPELDRRYAVDPGRVYAAGFSGGAHVAWLLGRSGGLAGVIASGGRDSPEWLVDDIPFASYGAAGTVDFNFAGMHTVDRHFASRGAAHRLEIFEGRHGWMPPELAFEAMGWMEVVAMTQGRRPVDRELAAERAAADLAVARSLEGRGELLWAAERYRAIVDTYAPLIDTAAAAVRLQTLEAGKAFRAASRERQRWDSFETAWRSRLGAALTELSVPQRPMTAGRLAARLEIRHLQHLAADGETRQARRTAQRMLETAFVQTAFYLQRDLRASGQYRKAAVVLEVAARIHPGEAVLLYNLACAEALSGHRREALDALAAALDAGFTDRHLLETDPDLDDLRDEEAFRRLVQRLNVTGPATPPP